MNNIAVTSRGEELHIPVHHRRLHIAISVTATAAPRLPRASFDPTYQWEEGGKATHGGSGYCNWLWCAEACITATAMCSTSPLVVIVINGWQGRRRRIALFCDKLTNLGWLTLSVLKYLMKIKKFICESAWETNAIAWCFQLHLWMDFFLRSVTADNCTDLRDHKCNRPNKVGKDKDYCCWRCVNILWACACYPI